MDENRVEEFLEHYGIKGQRLGIRRTPEQLGHLEHGDWKNHKYVSKHPSKTSGRMVYVYKESGGKIKKTPKKYSLLEDILGFDEKDAFNVADYEYRIASSRFSNKEYSSREEMQKEFDRISKLGKRAQDFYDSYKSTPIGVLDSAKETVDKGREFVADLLENAADTIRPKKK